MGMLQLAGAVSGFGQGLQQGLQNTQAYMSQSMMQKERDEMELNRLRLTFGHDRGLLGEKFAHEDAQLATREAGETNRTNIREAGANSRYDSTITSNELIADKHETGENSRTTQRINAAKDEGDAERTNRKELQTNDLRFRQEEGVRSRTAEMAKLQTTMGFEILKQTQTLAAAKTAQKLDPGVDRYIDTLMEELKGLNKRLENYPSPDEATKIQKRIDEIGPEIRSLTGIKPYQPSGGGKGSGVDISKYDPYITQSPLHSGSSRANAESNPVSPIQADTNRPRMGNVEPTLADLTEFKRQYDAASQSGGQVSSVVEDFKNRFGRVPTQANYDRVRNVGR